MLHLRTGFAICFCAILVPFSVPAGARSAEGAPFAVGTVEELAKGLAKEAFVPPQENVPEPWASIGYDQFRDIRFRRERAIWHGERRNFELHLLPTGFTNIPSPSTSSKTAPRAP